jgi:hypothetical protein
MPHVQPARNASAAKIACASDLSGLIHQLTFAVSSSGRLIFEERGMLQW